MTGAPWKGHEGLIVETDPQYDDALMQLAIKQRMTTDVRRAVFCVIMGSNDYVDAFERFVHTFYRS